MKNYRILSELERFIFGEFSDGFSRDYVISEAIDIFSDRIPEDEIIDLVYDIDENY